MDTLTFNSPILLRHLTFSEAKKMPISAIHLGRALEGLEMTMDQVCIHALAHSHLLFWNCYLLFPWTSHLCDCMKRRTGKEGVFQIIRFGLMFRL